MKHSRRYNENAEKVKPAEKVGVTEAVKIIKSYRQCKFDETVEVSLKLGIDPRQADQAVRGSVVLPRGLGKTLRVIAFAEGEDAVKATDAGAVEVGGDDLVKKIQGGWLQFDVAIAHPKMMSRVGKLGRLLGPKGLMPSPKSGTVTPDVATAVQEFAAGKVEYRADSGGNVHAPVGKVSFSDEDLVENIGAFTEHIRANRPTAVKGTFLQKVCVSTSMGPGIGVETS